VEKGREKGRIRGRGWWGLIGAKYSFHMAFNSFWMKNLTEWRTISKRKLIL